MRIDEKNFLNELKNKNPKAMEYIFDVYGTVVYRVIFRVLKSSEYSTYIDECVDDCFICVWNNIDTFHEEKGTFKNWILAIAKYKAINCKKKIMKSINVESIENYTFKSKEQVEDKLVSKENVKDIVKIIEQMSKVDREIFIKRYLMQENIVDIAKALGVTRAVIDNRLTRGRKLLKEKLAFLKEGGCINE